MLKTRNRLVNFRLTQDEYNKIQAAVLTKGMRCLSDFARDAVLRYAESDAAGPDQAQSSIANIDRRVSELERSVRAIQSLLPDVTSKADGAGA